MRGEEANERRERKRCERVGWHNVVQMGMSDGKFAAESEILVSLTSSSSLVSSLLVALACASLQP